MGVFSLDQKQDTTSNSVLDRLTPLELGVQYLIEIHALYNQYSTALDHSGTGQKVREKTRKASGSDIVSI